ncbi:TIGR03668 family PPOX class F420-dependent oxidoreductase [Streptomyces sp. 8K308]|uniref:TIGR03668 family PPOX class F420-dependent oxidoreductase n=1 Tax=Streptomyces sp. 8K308 TaxID=2530388 RepID=UPI0010491765|nr:TIGR03668 family PPOX class F420-dependent oxidoreductase [Streptomyces sp. 8K308]TDC10491.1 TIGR03668 family PPOX class F420-dependent oxidoreductase [Streptomyces sp. 8K308]
MRLPPATARRLVTSARILRLATLTPDGAPHQVPATFAAHGDTLVTAVDHKPKRHQRLRRLTNIAADPRVCVLVDHYDDDWTHLWWARGDGTARVLDDDARHAPVDRLLAKYPQYRNHPPEGPVIEITITHWTGWSYADLP